MKKRKTKFPKKHKATYISLLGAKRFREDSWAKRFFCGEESEDFGLEFSCIDCLREEGIVW